jgi:hypothetical protein
MVFVIPRKKVHSIPRKKKLGLCVVLYTLQRCKQMRSEFIIFEIFQKTQNLQGNLYFARTGKGLLAAHFRPILRYWLWAI